MPSRTARASWKPFLLVQALLLAVLGTALGMAGGSSRSLVNQQLLARSPYQSVAIARNEPLTIAPLYDRPDLVSDADLAAVLRQIQPRFPREKMKPNHVEHALRAWGIHATFADPQVASGKELAEFLTDNAKYVESWGESMRPLLEQRSNDALAVRWGMSEVGGSVHHDHWLASLTEAGAKLDTPVFGPGRSGHTLGDVLQESLRDFRLDERETEWTAMAFGFWIAPTKQWTGGDGRQYSFDLLATRLMRGQKQLGVCAGTHRVYSLAVLLRLDDEFKILSSERRAEIVAYLESVRDDIAASQFPDGHWPSNWPDGAAAVKSPIEEELYKQVIATGHHLEWMAIAPRELHVCDEQIKRAIDWVVATTKSQSQDDILQRYTFFSHVGNALALWRNTRPATFWKNWEQRSGSAAATVR